MNKKSNLKRYITFYSLIKKVVASFQLFFYDVELVVTMSFIRL